MTRRMTSTDDGLLVTGKNIIVVTYALILLIFLALLVVGLDTGADGTLRLFAQVVIAGGLMSSSYSGQRWATKLLVAGALLVGLRGLILAFEYENLIKQASGLGMGVAFLFFAGALSSRPARAFFAAQAQNDEEDDASSEPELHQDVEEPVEESAPYLETEDSVTCSDCGAPNDPRWRNCDECGVTMAAVG